VDSKPRPDFDLSEVTEILAQVETVVVDEDRDWFMVRDLEVLWEPAVSSTCRKRLLKLIRSGVVKYDRDRLIPNKLNPSRSAMVPTYRIVKGEGDVGRGSETKE
jgi:hypothetical protein